jgi:hypothetical protein
MTPLTRAHLALTFLKIERLCGLFVAAGFSLRLGLGFPPVLLRDGGRHPPCLPSLLLFHGLC